MKLANCWSVGTAAIALVLASAPAASGEVPQPAAAPMMEATIQPVIAPAPVSAPVVSPAPLPQAPEPAAFEVDLDSLDPGEFVWRPELATAGPVEMVVSIPLQVAYIYRGGALIGVTTVSTGRRGHATPTGTFPILEKRREHYSNLYNNAPMPFMQRLTWDGIALHAGQIPGHPASHGCVRLPREFARLLFSVTQVGGEVHIVDSSPSPNRALAEVRGQHVVPAAQVALASMR